MEKELKCKSVAGAERAHVCGGAGCAGEGRREGEEIRRLSARAWRVLRGRMDAEVQAPFQEGAGNDCAGVGGQMGVSSRRSKGPPGTGE